MIKKNILFIFILITAVFNQVVQGQYLIKKEQVGNLRIGNSADLIYQEYDYDQTQLVDLLLEGFYTPAIQVMNKAGSVDFTAEIQCGKIYRFKIYDKKYSTQEGVSVGAKVSEVIAKHQIEDEVLIGETGYFIYSKELNISFELNLSQLNVEGVIIKTNTKLKEIPKHIVIVAILVVKE